MRNLNKYIIEKLHLNKDIKTPNDNEVRLLYKIIQDYIGDKTWYRGTNYSLIENYEQQQVELKFKVNINPNELLKYTEALRKISKEKYNSRFIFSAWAYERKIMAYIDDTKEEITEKLRLDKNLNSSNEAQDVISYINDWLDSFINLEYSKDYEVSSYVEHKRVKIYYYFKSSLDEKIFNKIELNIHSILDEMKKDLGYKYYRTIRFGAIDKYKSMTLENSI